MKNIKETLAAASMITAGIVLVCVIIYGSYWVVKNVSYIVFYEGLVQETIVEMVNKDSLAKP